jgi:hypothetical protein
MVNEAKMRSCRNALCFFVSFRRLMYEPIFCHLSIIKILLLEQALYVSLKLANPVVFVKLVSYLTDKLH